MGCFIMQKIMKEIILMKRIVSSSIAFVMVFAMILTSGMVANASQLQGNTHTFSMRVFFNSSADYHVKEGIYGFRLDKIKLNRIKHIK